MTRLLVSVLIVLLSTKAYAEKKDPDQFLCIADLATGFSFDKTTKTWESTNFRVDGQKYIVKKVSEKNKQDAEIIKKLKGEKKLFWKVTEFGKESLVTNTYCEYYTPNDTIICDFGIFYKYKISIKNLRYIKISTWGYWDDDLTDKNSFKKEGGNSPHLEIGKCSPL